MLLEQTFYFKINNVSNKCFHTTIFVFLSLAPSMTENNPRLIFLREFHVISSESLLQ